MPSRARLYRFVERQKKNSLEKNGVALGYNLLRMFIVEFASGDIVFMN